MHDSPHPPRQTARSLGAVAAIAIGIAVLSAPQAAQAIYAQYAYHTQAHEVTSVYSSTTSINGGKGYADSGLMRTYIQTLSGGYLVASAYGANGATVYMSHVSYSGARSRCYWDYVGGTVAGNPTVGMNCWRSL